MLIDRKDSTLNYEIDHPLRAVHSLFIFTYVTEISTATYVQPTYLQTGAVRDLLMTWDSLQAEK